MSSAIRNYWPQYKWSNVLAMIRNMRREPERNTGTFRDRLVVITGATTGIGYRTARKYAAMNARIVMVNRNPEKSERVRREIADEFGAQIEDFIADLSLLADMQRTGRYLLSLEKPIDVLIHNAGVHLESRRETSEGLEVNFAVHYLCPLIVTRMLMPKYQRDRTGRIILVSSEAYRFAVWGLDLEDLQWKRRRYSGIQAYGAGKLAQIQSMHILARELAPLNVSINAMHPGMVRTESGKDNSRLYRWYKKHVIDKFSDSPDVSAEALYFLGTSPEVTHSSDVFFHLTTAEELTPPARDLEAAEALWNTTGELLRQRGVAL